ncbi:MAG: GntR family transcriptional regulator [Verrucomicrobiae bacterium]|nr:GntR family transcriptional regulator [Verrucomicrobiae bacterium]
MLPFFADFKAGVPIAGQIVQAVKKAVFSGRMRAGARFPSVRTISQELRANPNTVHKAVEALVKEGILEVRTDLGVVVGKNVKATPGQRRELLEEDVESLIGEAKKLRLDVDDVLQSVRQHWKKSS